MINTALVGAGLLAIKSEATCLTEHVNGTHETSRRSVRAIKWKDVLQNPGRVRGRNTQRQPLGPPLRLTSGYRIDWLFRVPHVQQRANFNAAQLWARFQPGFNSCTLFFADRAALLQANQTVVVAANITSTSNIASTRLGVRPYCSIRNQLEYPASTTSTGKHNKHRSTMRTSHSG